MLKWHVLRTIFYYGIIHPIILHLSIYAFNVGARVLTHVHTYTHSHAILKNLYLKRAVFSDNFFLHRLLSTVIHVKQIESNAYGQNRINGIFFSLQIHLRMKSMFLRKFHQTVAYPLNVQIVLFSDDVNIYMQYSVLKYVF